MAAVLAGLMGGFMKVKKEIFIFILDLSVILMPTCVYLRKKEDNRAF